MVNNSRKKLRAVEKTASNGRAELNICHLADVHLGYRRYSRLTPNGLNQREVDISQAFSEAVTRIIGLRPNITIIAGDLFHSVRPSNAIVAFAFREIKRLSTLSAAPVVIIAGNHETPKRSDTGNVLRILAEIPGVFIADSSLQRFNFRELELSVTCLPHAALINPPAAPIRADDKFPYNLLVLHAQVDRGIMSDYGGAEISLARFSPNEWDYIALGHLHFYKQIGGNAAYCGSTEHTAASIWSESDRNKGFLQILLPSGKQIFHALSSPREVVALGPLDAAELEPQQVSEMMDQLLSSVPGGADGKIIKVTLNNIAREVFRQLDHKMIRRWRNRCLNLTLDPHMPYRHGEASRIGLSRRATLRDELRDFVKEYQLETVSKIEVEHMLISYLDKLEESSEAREVSA